MKVSVRGKFVAGVWPSIRMYAKKAGVMKVVMIVFESWTKELYDEAADLSESGDVTLGIKRNCMFNELKSFHCIGQLPPCLGHDFYEGVFAYDIQIYLQYILTKEKLISVSEFNGRLKSMKLDERDSKNRPKDFKVRKENTKYEGNSGSLRVLSRILPMLLTREVEESGVGEAILRLSEVSQLVTAPKLTVEEVEGLLHFSILEYLEMRREMIGKIDAPTMKPKHHFLSHYAHIYRENGPLIHLWSMRMESKGGFNTRNF